jgi:hypothetical protein
MTIEKALSHRLALLLSGTPGKRIIRTRKAHQ